MNTFGLLKKPQHNTRTWVIWKSKNAGRKVETFSELKFFKKSDFIFLHCICYFAHSVLYSNVQESTFHKGKRVEVTGIGQVGAFIKRIQM